MARPPRIEGAGALYHLTTHANPPERLFRDDMDREELIDRLIVEVDERRWVCHAYCLMDTHYHLLIETPDPDLAKGLHRLNGRYAWEFNRRHGRNGHLFASRYHAAPLESQGHLLEVIRYVVLNPVRAGACLVPEAWAWSSYRATAGLAESPRFLRVEWVLGQFASTRLGAQTRYRSFVADGIERPVALPRPRRVPGTVSERGEARAVRASPRDVREAHTGLPGSVVGRGARA